MITGREKEILDLIKSNPFISQQQIADQLDIKRSSVAVHILNLTRKGYIKGKGYLLKSSPYVIVIGGSNMDIAGFSANTIQSRDSNPGSIVLSQGGVGRNIAENLCRIGVDTKLITAIGNDFYGKQIIEHCSKLGVDLSLSKILSGHPTSVYLSVINHQGDMEVAISDMKIIDEINISHIKGHVSLLHNAAAIVADTNLREDVLHYLIDCFPTNLFLDTVSTIKTQKIKGHLKNIHTIKPNRVEAEILINSSINTEKQIRKAIRNLIDLGIRNVVISLGEKGVAFGNKDQFEIFQPPSVTPKNTTGAGDAFMAGLVYGKLKKMSLKETIRFASAMSQLTLEDDNTNNPNLTIALVNQKLDEKQR